MSILGGKCGGGTGAFILLQQKTSAYKDTEVFIEAYITIIETCKRVERSLFCSYTTTTYIFTVIYIQ
jgi:hypothetical protein